MSVAAATGAATGAPAAGSLRRRCSRKRPLCRRTGHAALPPAGLAALPLELLRRLLAAGRLRELLAASGTSRRLRAATLAALRGSAVHAELQLCRDAPEGIELDVRALWQEQPCTGSPIRAKFRLCRDGGGETARPYLREELVEELLHLLPCKQAVYLVIRAVSGLSSFQHGADRLLTRWPIRSLSLACLEEEDVLTLCAVVRALPSLEALHVHNFCRDNPTAEYLDPLLAALPASCVELEVCHALPLVRAFLRVPATVQKLGWLVLMTEIFYHSRVVGMSLAHFAAAFPVLPAVQELRAILGPGHYEEPGWPSGKAGARAAAGVLLQKFPGLGRLVVEAAVESPSSPPLVDLGAALQQRGVTLRVLELRAASRRASAGVVRKVAERLRAAGVELGESLDAQRDTADGQRAANSSGRKGARCPRVSQAEPSN